MFLLSLFVAHAGDLEVTLTLDEDDVRTVHFEDLPSCTPVKASISGETGWSVRAIATTFEPSGDVWIELAIDAWTQPGRDQRRVKTNPTFRSHSGQDAVMTMAGPDGTFTIKAVASDFALEPSCANRRPSPAGPEDRAEERRTRGAERSRTSRRL